MRYLAQSSHILWYFGFDKTSKATPGPKKRQAEILTNSHISIKFNAKVRSYRFPTHVECYHLFKFRLFKKAFQEVNGFTYGINESKRKMMHNDANKETCLFWDCLFKIGCSVCQGFLALSIRWRYSWGVSAWTEIIRSQWKTAKHAVSLFFKEHFRKRGKSSFPPRRLSLTLRRLWVTGTNNTPYFPACIALGVHHETP